MVLKNIPLILLVTFITSCSSSSVENSIVISKISGQELYEKNCAQCHGTDGKLGNSGATDLSMSVLSDEACKKRIKNGLNAMPPMAEVLGSEANIDSVVQYIKTFRKE